MTADQIAEERRRRGLCLTCFDQPTTCYDISIKGAFRIRSRKALTKAGVVLRGCCLRCNPELREEGRWNERHPHIRKRRGRKTEMELHLILASSSRESGEDSMLSAAVTASQTDVVHRKSDEDPHPPGTLSGRHTTGVRPLPHRSKGSINIGDGASPPSAEGNDWGVNVNPDSRYTYENMTYRPSLIVQRERYRHLQMGERSSPRIDKEVGAVILPTDEEKEEVEEKVEVEGTEFADRNPSTSRVVVAVVLEENSSIVPRMDGIGGQRVTTRRLYSDGRRTVMIRDVEDGAEAEAGGELIMEEMELHPTIVQGGSDVKKGVMEKDGVYVEAVGVDNEVWDEDELGLQVALRLSLQDAEW